MFNRIREWVDGEKLTALKFNEQIDQNIEWIRKRNISVVTVRNGISDWSQTTLDTWQAIDPTVLFVEITTRGEGGNLLITANLNITNAGVTGGTLLDFFIQPHGEGGFYLSSLTTTPLTDGLFEEEFGSGYSQRKSYQFLWLNTPANSYKITVYWLAKIGTNSLNYTNTVNQLIAEEYGVYP